MLNLQITDTYLNKCCVFNIISAAIEGAVGRSENVVACYDRAATIWLRFVWRHQADLYWNDIVKYKVFHYSYLLLCYVIIFCPTCHGYSLTSVSTPPTILIRLLACPQVQVLPLEIGAAVGGAMIVATHMIKFY